MAPEAGQPEKPAALKPGAPAPARKADRRPPSGGKRAGRPQQAPRNGNGARAAMPGQRTAEGRPERGVPLQGFPSLGSRPRDVPQTSSRSRFRHGNDSAGERFFHVQVRFPPPSAHWSPSPLKARPYRLRKARPLRRRSSTGRAAKPAPRPANTTGAARTVTWASVTNASWRSTASQTSSPASSPCGKACR